MKKIIPIALLAFSINANAQTPYDSFAPEAKRDMLGKPLPTFELFNTDSCATVKKIKINLENNTLAYYGAQDALIEKVNLKPTDYKWWSVDPMAQKYPSSSPYNFVDGNPISRTDPNGADWFKDENGNTTWHQATGNVGDQVSLKGLEGTWTNIGTEFLQFNGQQLTYSWQTMDKSGNPMVNSMSFDAVSGKGTDPTGYWNITRSFDYSSANQQQANLGPVPAGLYSINKAPFVPGQNESGTQKFEDQSLARQMASPFGLGTWPGGTASWGDYRWQLQNEGANTNGRGGFYLHGGDIWGSRGCIDCGAGINNFYNAFTTTNPQNTGQVYLKVTYAEDLKYEIQNRPTTMPLVNPNGQPINH